MSSIFFLLQRATEIVSILCAIFFANYIFNAARHKERPSNPFTQYSVVVIISLIISVIISAPFQQLVKISNIEILAPGEYCCFVKLENDYGTNSQTIPARISIGFLPEDADGSYGQPISLLSRHYYLKEVYLPSGQMSMHGELTINSEEVVESDNGSSWMCTLLNEKAYYPDEEFNNGITPFSVILFILKMAVQATVLFFLVHAKRKETVNQKTEY